MKQWYALSVSLYSYNNVEGGYFRIDDDNNMGYRYILLITYILYWNGPVEHIQHQIYCNENKR